VCVRVGVCACAHGRDKTALDTDKQNIVVKMQRISYLARALRLVVSLKLYVSFAKEPYKRDNILQKRPMILNWV